MSESKRWARALRCSATGEAGALDEPTNLSPAGAPWLVDYDVPAGAGPAWAAEVRTRPWSLWRYRELLPLTDFDARVDLGEGGTPLVHVKRGVPDGVEVWVKEEGGNPTGSFKDRGLSLAVNRARELGAPGVQLASAGNAALALTAYAAASGLPSRVAMPEDTPPTIMERCRGYGAHVLTSPGTLVEAASRLTEFDDGYWTLSTFREPYRVEGKKTMGLEVAEVFDWQLPDWIIYPTGGGTGIVGMRKVFDELERLGLVDGRRPHFCAVQMAGCAPIVRAFEAGATSADPWRDPHTTAWGLRVPKSLGDALVLDALYATDGAAVAVPEEALDGKRAHMSAQAGRLVGPEGAACLLALDQLVAAGRVLPGHRAIIFQTGHPANYGLV